MTDIAVVIFSYNRGNYVKNCIASVHKACRSVDLKIYDDGSSDTTTLNYLADISEPVVHCRSDSHDRHGGLYANMQRALDETNAKYLLFLQDDTQFVREIDASDLDCIDRFFDSEPKAAFLNPVFLKGHRRRSIQQQLVLLPEYEGYIHEISEKYKPRPVSMYYCDVVIARVDRLKAADWVFKKSETENAEQARTLFSKMLQMAHPFVMHVPEVPVFRGKVSTYGSRLANKRVGAEVKTFAMMAVNEVRDMKSRDIARPPFAEDFIQTLNSDVDRPFRYNSISKSFTLKLLHKIELALFRP